MGIFDLFTAPVIDAIDVANNSLDYLFEDGDGPSKEKVARLVSTGLTVAVVAQGFGVAEEIIQNLMEG